MQCSSSRSASPPRTCAGVLSRCPLDSALSLVATLCLTPLEDETDESELGPTAARQRWLQSQSSRYPPPPGIAPRFVHRCPPQPSFMFLIMCRAQRSSHARDCARCVPTRTFPPECYPFKAQSSALVLLVARCTTSQRQRASSTSVCILPSLTLS